MKQIEITIRVKLARGDQSATVWTCDLSHDYVSINRRLPLLKSRMTSLDLFCNVPKAYATFRANHASAFAAA